MEPANQQKIEQTVLEILKQADIEEMTEFKVRTMASERLGIDLSNVVQKKFIRGVVESFLLSTVEETGVATKEADANVQRETSHQQVNIKKKVNFDGDRIICQLSKMRNVAVQDFKGRTIVSIRDYYGKDGKQYPSAKGINLPTDQWATFRKNVPAIEEAIKKMQTKIRSEGGGQKGVVSDSVTSPTELVLTEPNRFNGRNYLYWAPQMEIFLKQLKIEYVLNNPCPGVTLSPQASTEEISKVKVAERKWVHDDHICRRHILNCLSDNLYYQYSKKTTSAKELWEELKLVYLYEEFGTKRSVVKKYIEFQMADEKSILKQIQEFNNIADSIVAAGMMIDENFHVSVIISKLPPSWKDFCVKLMHEEYLTFGMLMNHIYAEEESRRPNNQGEPSNTIEWHLAKGIGSRMREIRKPGMSWKRRESEIGGKTVFCNNCGKKGHISKHCRSRKFGKEMIKRQKNSSTTPTNT